MGSALSEPLACIESSYLLFQKYIKMVQESRPETASPLGPLRSPAESSRCSVPKAIAAEGNDSETEEQPGNYHSSLVVLPKLLFISDGQKRGISTALEEELF